MNHKKYNYPFVSLVILIIFLIFFFRNKLNNKESDFKMTFCKELYNDKYQGKVIEKSYGRGWNYRLDNRTIFITYSPCNHADSLIEVSDSIYKPANSFDLYLYKKSNKDSLIYLPCSFSCDSLPKK